MLTNRLVKYSASMSVLVVGSANYDLVFKAESLPKPGETLMATGFETHPGGKGANQAVACGKLGGDVAFCGCVGSDAFGDLLLESLQSAGVDVSFLKRVEGPSGTAGIAVDQHAQNMILVCPSANAKVTPEHVATALREKQPKVVLAQLEIPMAAVAEASKHPRFILNPAPACPIPDDLLKNCYAIIPNESEAAALTGISLDSDQSIEMAAKKLRERGPKNIVITLGARGCYFLTEDESGFIGAPKVQPVDTTAAGDAFCGGLALGLDQGRPWRESLQIALAVGSLSTTRAGAQPSMPCWNEVAALLNR